MKKRILLIPVLLLLSISFLSFSADASFSLKNESINKQYSSGQMISGKINISFSDQEAISNLSSNFDGKITLLDFLENNGLEKGIDYNCSTPNCGEDYSIKSPINSFNLEGEKIIGLKVAGLKNSDIDSIESVKFKLVGDSGPQCLRQITLDFLIDGENIVTNKNYLDETCFTKNKGCFDSGAQLTEATISSSKLCSKLTLPAGPAFKLGANVKNSTNGYGELKMSLWDYEDPFNALGRCTLPKHTSKDYQELECNVIYPSSSEREYYVCIEGSEKNYKIKTETSGEICGTGDLGSETFTSDFELFARPLKFDNVNFEINESGFENEFNIPLTEYLHNYIYGKYESSCDPYCVIPIKIEGTAQQIQISDVFIKYKTGGVTLEDNNIYDVEKKKAKISSGPLELELSEANFTIPIGATQSKFTLFLGTDRVFERIINLTTSFDFDISPKFSLIGQETTFKISSFYNITQSEWEFEDGKKVTSTGSEAKYLFTNQGNYNVKVTAKTSLGKTSSKTFQIIVGNPQQSAEKLLNETDAKISSLSSSINKKEEWIKKELEKEYDLSELNSKLSQIKISYQNALEDEDYISVISSLLELNIPSEIIVSEKGSIPLPASIENADLSLVEEVSGKEFKNNELLFDYISSWILDNYDSSIEFEKISAVYDSKSEVIFTKVKLRIVNKNGGDDLDKYILISYPYDNIIFRSSYGEKGISGGSATSMRLSGNDYEFLLPEDVDLLDLGIYLSPDITKLDLIDESEILNEDENTKDYPLGRVLFFLAILLVFTLAAYVSLQEWYKRHYENFLFKNKDDLYNIINFIYNGRISGLKDLEIKLKLLDVKWGKEQLNYAFRKIDGKRTGMYEIPIFKFFENNKVKEEIAKRQPTGKVDVRFIKRPNL